MPVSKTFSTSVYYPNWRLRSLVKTGGKGPTQIRMPCAIGFYPGEKQALLRSIEKCYLNPHGPNKRPKVNQSGARRIIAGIAPHAGYIYSGPVAASLYYEVALDGVPQTFVLVGPLHGFGAGVATMRRGVWRTPLGDTPIDEGFSEALLKHGNIIIDDPTVHEGEHSLEVQLPFLQSLYGDRLRIVPIATSLGDPETCAEIGRAIAKATAETKKDVAIIASTDMTHYGIHYGYAPVGMSPIEKVLRWVKDIDAQAIEAIKTLDEKKLLALVSEKHMTMCGYAPVAIAMVAAKESGASRVELLKYATSYDTQGSEDAIVGYCSILMQK
jgi:AmmeMemoRadiSam system protein B